MGEALLVLYFNIKPTAKKIIPTARLMSAMPHFIGKFGINRFFKAIMMTIPESSPPDPSDKNLFEVLNTATTSIYTIL